MGIMSLGGIDMARQRIYDDGLTPQERYDQKNRKLVSMRFNMVTEKDIYDHLMKQPNKQGYLKCLIRRDMEDCERRE